MSPGKNESRLNKFLRIVALLVTVPVALVTILGKGGGGDDNTPLCPEPLPEGTMFLTTDPNFDAPGESANFDLTGTATGNGASEAATGSVSINRQDNQTLDAEEVTVTYIVVTLEVPSQSIMESSGGTRYDGLDRTVRLVETVDSLTCTPTGPAHVPIPLSVEVGDSGVVGEMACNDGSTRSESYLVERSDRNCDWAAIRIFNTVTIPGESDATGEIIYHVTEDGRTQEMDVNSSDGTFSLDLGT